VLAADGPRGGRVAACSAAAAAQGVRPDMPLAEAKSLVPGLAIERYDPQQDCQALRKLAEECEQFSPCVALEEGVAPESLLLDISNLAHLMGSDAELAARVDAFFTARGWRVRIAVAETVGGAWAVAHFGKEFRIADFGLRIGVSQSAIRNPQSAISHLPIEALRIAEDTAALLRQLGIETVGQLLALPREGLASRFGDQLLLRLDQMTGAVAEVLVPHRAPAALAVGCTLEYPTADRALVTYVLAGLVEQLAGQLAARDQGAVLLMCVLRSADGRSLPLRIGLFEPSASARQLMELIGLHLETVVLADEVLHVEIRAAAVGRLGQRQGELFADRWPSDPHQLAVLVNRLSSRLGNEQVVRPELRPGALPERAVRWTPMTEKSRVMGRESRARKSSARTPALDSRLSTLDSAPRPLLLYPEPRAIDVVCVAPDGPPQLVWLEGRRERIAGHAGPERIETLWWAGESVRRDYYRVATESGSHLWIFRRLTDGHWFLHGVFA